MIAVRGADNPSGNDGPRDEIRRSEAVAQTQLSTAGGGNGSRTAFGLSLPNTGSVTNGYLSHLRSIAAIPGHTHQGGSQWSHR